jgi:FkbM family methyltransferase
MTYIYPQDNAYDVIQSDIENNFYKIINKKREEIKNIVIIGAYHGYEIFRLLSIYPNCTIHAFEAVEKHFLVLQNTFKNNSRVKTYNKAVSDIVEDAFFYELGNGGQGSGSLLKFSGHELGHPFKINEILKVKTTTLKNELPNLEIDLLWVDVQGAELKVLKGTNLNNCSSLFLEIHTHDFINLWDKQPYEGQCYKEDLESYLSDFILHSIGLDNCAGNGQGNSFWIKKLL